VLILCISFCVCIIVFVYVYLVVFVFFFFFVASLSVLWYCWLGFLTCKNRLPYNLYCVGGDVKHCSINQSIAQSFEQLTGFVYQIWLHLTGFTQDYFVCVRLFSCIISPCLYYCDMVRWTWLDWGLSGWLTTVLQCFYTVGWVIGPVKHGLRNDLNCVEWDVKPSSTHRDVG